MVSIEKLGILEPDGIEVVNNRNLSGPHYYGFPFERLLELINSYGAFTCTRVLTNQKQHMVDFIAADKEFRGLHNRRKNVRDTNTLVLTDGIINLNDVIDEGSIRYHKVSNAGYAAQIVPFGKGNEEITHQIMIWVSEEFLPHGDVKRICRDILTDSFDRVFMEPLLGKSSRI